MQTIEEATNEYVNNHTIIFPESAVKKAFKAGVEFAQRWINIEDKLPEIDKENPRKLYLVKVIEGSMTPKEIITVAYLRNRWKWSCEMDWVRVISWRPIELK